jgi:hypothetical protein
VAHLPKSVAAKADPKDVRKGVPKVDLLGTVPVPVPVDRVVSADSAVDFPALARVVLVLAVPVQVVAVIALNVRATARDAAKDVVKIVANGPMHRAMANGTRTRRSS